jgi:hypothetical protein
MFEAKEGTNGADIKLREAEQAILQVIAETIGKNETHPNGSKLVNPWTCDDCGTPQEEFTRNKLRDEIRAKLGITGDTE